MELELIELKDIKAVPDIIHVYPERVKSECTPLVIDNGNTFVSLFHYNCHFRIVCKKIIKIY